MEEAMAKAWDEYIQDGGTRGIHLLFEIGFRRGWDAKTIEAENQRKNDEWCNG